jgi:hypothetical protein
MRWWKNNRWTSWADDLFVWLMLAVLILLMIFGMVMLLGK